MKIGLRVASETFGPLRGQHQRDRIHAGEAESAGGELVDPADGAEHCGDRCLAFPSVPHVTDERRQVVSSDAVEPAVSEGSEQVLLDRAAIAGLGGRAEVQHRRARVRR